MFQLPCVVYYQCIFFNFFQVGRNWQQCLQVVVLLQPQLQVVLLLPRPLHQKKVSENHVPYLIIIPLAVELVLHHTGDMFKRLFN